jgi:hypothetical protein
MWGLSEGLYTDLAVDGWGVVCDGLAGCRKDRNASAAKYYLIESTVASQNNMRVFYLDNSLSQSDQIRTNAYSSTGYHGYCHHLLVSL